MADLQRKIVKTEANEAVIVSDEGKFALNSTDRVNGYVHMHDAWGRPLYDETGRPMLIAYHQQKAFVPSMTYGIWFLVVLQIGTIIAGIVAAVALHHLSSGGY